MQRNDSKPVSVPNIVAKPGYVPFAKDTSIDQRIRDKVISGEGVKVRRMRIWATELLALKNEDVLKEYLKVANKTSSFSVKKRSFCVWLAQQIMRHERDKQKQKAEETEPVVVESGADVVKAAVNAIEKAVPGEAVYVHN